MSSRKIVIDRNKIEDFLKKNFNNSSKIIKEFSENEVSRAFLLSTQDREYVIRVDSVMDTFAKDKYAYEHFATEELIIPKTVQLGKIEEGLFYSITEKLDGITLNELNDLEFKNVLPNLASVLRKIHNTDISKTTGYGNWGIDGKGDHKSWKDYIISLRKSKYWNWDEMFSKDKYEKELFDKAYNKMIGLSKFISEDRFLLHGDYGFSNVLIENGKVTGVLDWGVSKYGDFIYDIAWLDFWAVKTNYGAFLKDYYVDKNLSSYDERLLCYKCHVGLTSSGFFAKYGDANGYEFTKNRLLKFL